MPPLLNSGPRRGRGRSARPGAPSSFTPRILQTPGGSRLPISSSSSPSLWPKRLLPGADPAAASECVDVCVHTQTHTHTPPPPPHTHTLNLWGHRTIRRAGLFLQEMPLKMHKSPSELQESASTFVLSFYGLAKRGRKMGKSCPPKVLRAVGSGGDGRLPQGRYWLSPPPLPSFFGLIPVFSPPFLGEGRRGARAPRAWGWGGARARGSAAAVQFWRSMAGAAAHLVWRRGPRGGRACKRAAGGRGHGAAAAAAGGARSAAAAPNRTLGGGGGALELAAAFHAILCPAD